MRCQDVERLILEEPELGPEERDEMESHLSRCARCSDLRNFKKALHERVAEVAAPELPAGLDERVRKSAHAELIARLGGRRAAGARPDVKAEVPGLIWAALAAITVLTLSFLIPGVQDLVENQKLTLGTGLVLILILQNALTLFFAPVVLRRERNVQGG